MSVDGLVNEWHSFQTLMYYTELTLSCTPDTDIDLIKLSRAPEKDITLRVPIWQQFDDMSNVCRFSFTLYVLVTKWHSYIFPKLERLIVLSSKKLETNYEGPTFRSDFFVSESVCVFECITKAGAHININLVLSVYL